MDGSKSMAPFAIEKAVHNIMFIKHHMKRQDEFDAVKYSSHFYVHSIRYSREAGPIAERSKSSDFYRDRAIRV